jgi:hypothetical protein
MREDLMYVVHMAALEVLGARSSVLEHGDFGRDLEGVVGQVNTSGSLLEPQEVLANTEYSLSEERFLLVEVAENTLTEQTEEQAQGQEDYWCAREQKAAQGTWEVALVGEIGQG